MNLVRLSVDRNPLRYPPAIKRAMAQGKHLRDSMEAMFVCEIVKNYMVAHANDSKPQSYVQKLRSARSLSGYRIHDALAKATQRYNEMVSSVSRLIGHDDCMH